MDSDSYRKIIIRQLNGIQNHQKEEILKQYINWVIVMILEIVLGEIK